MATYDFKFMFKPLCVVQSLLTSLLSQSLETTSLVISWWICLLRTVRGFAFEDGLWICLMRTVRGFAFEDGLWICLMRQSVDLPLRTLPVNRLTLGGLLHLASLSEHRVFGVHPRK